MRKGMHSIPFLMCVLSFLAQQHVILRATLIRGELLMRRKLLHLGWISAIVGALLIVLMTSSISAQEPAATEEPAAPVGTEEPGAEGEMSRGEYLVRVVAACEICHATNTPPYSPVDALAVELAGGGEFAFEPFGVVYASNLTTLGEWTDEAIENAIRYGVRPDGSLLLPPMPYEAYARMSDADMAAMIEYLRSLEPVENVIPEAELVEGVTRDTVRTAPEMTTEEILGPAADASPAERGAYLGIAAAACVKCHGSNNEDGTINLDGPLTGERILNTEFGEVNPPSLTGADLEDWDAAGLETFIRGQINDPIFFMPVYAYEHLTAEDMADLIAWLQAQE